MGNNKNYNDRNKGVRPTGNPRPGSTNTVIAPEKVDETVRTQLDLKVAADAQLQEKVDLNADIMIEELKQVDEEIELLLVDRRTRDVKAIRAAATWLADKIEHKSDREYLSVMLGVFADEVEAGVEEVDDYNA